MAALRDETGPGCGYAAVENAGTSSLVELRITRAGRSSAP